MRRFIIAALSGILFIACKKNISGNNNPLSGVYIETSPLAGRSQLYFVSGNLLIKSVAGNNTKDSFYYSLYPFKIVLTPVSSKNTVQQFDYTKIDDASFEIESFYPNSSSAESFITFKK